MRNLFLFCSAVLALNACDSTPTTTGDSGVVDTGTGSETSVIDTGVDTGTPDTRVSETGAGDACNVSGDGSTGCGPTDSGTPDAGTTDTGTTDTGAPDGASGPSCAAYCAQITTNCTGANQQYIDMRSCMTICASFPPGSLTDTSGNTLGCRLYHSGAPAVLDAALHCPHGGPGGAGVCGDYCPSFCAAVMATCGTQTSPPYADLAACMTACSNPALSVPSGQHYNTGRTSGNNLLCRLYHLSVAASGGSDSASMSNLMTHCPHTRAIDTTCS